MNMRAINLAGCLMAVLAISSCSILPPAESPDIFVLPQATQTSSTAGAPELSWQLRVDTPEAIGLLANNGIVVMPEPGRVTVYKDARWSDNAPLLLRERLIDAFLASHRLPVVTSEDDTMHADFVLAGDLRAFQSEYRNGSPVVVVRFDAQLRRGASREVLVARSFETTAQPAGTAVPQVVQAFGEACDRLIAQVVAWTLAQGQQAGGQDDSSADAARQ